jgi:protein subunit release factor A
MYNSPDELFEVYSSYGNQQGFEVIKRSRKNDDEGKLRAVVYSCSKEGKSRSKDDAVHHKIQTKTGCQARVRATISPEVRH